MKKTKKTLEYFDYHELVETVEAKNGIDIRDVAGWSAIMSDQFTRLGIFMNEQFGNTHEQRVKEWSRDDPRWTKYTFKDILREGELHFDQVGYRDYWHFLTDLIDVHNGCIVNIDWADIRDIAIEADNKQSADLAAADIKDVAPNWRTKVTDMFIAEVGAGENDYLIAW